MIDVDEGRTHLLAVFADEPGGEHHRVRGRFTHRVERARDEGVGLLLVEADHVKGAVLAVERVGVIEHPIHVGVFAGVHHAVTVEVFFFLLEGERLEALVRLVGVVLAIVEDGGEVALAEIERHRLAEVR